jgi:hypothetical protein
LTDGNIPQDSHSGKQVVVGIYRRQSVSRIPCQISAEMVKVSGRGASDLLSNLANPIQPHKSCHTTMLNPIPSGIPSSDLASLNPHSIAPGLQVCYCFCSYCTLCFLRGETLLTQLPAIPGRPPASRSGVGHSTKIPVTDPTINLATAWLWSLRARRYNENGLISASRPNLTRKVKRHPVLGKAV